MHEVKCAAEGDDYIFMWAGVKCRTYGDGYLFDFNLISQR
jgi:hypothetical protein